jgi:ABC-type polysaccharide/polyol phosphate transport system ATPase subunit
MENNFLQIDPVLDRDDHAPVMEVDSVSKDFHIYNRHDYSVRGLFVYAFGGARQNVAPSRFSIYDISFSIKAGETWALIGRNGAGKSTLLRLIAGIYWPTRGRVIVRGRLAALIELGAGFHADLTGVENIFLYGNILGMKSSELKGLFQDIVDFSGIGKFINTPVKYYSSGMRIRLGFSVATAFMPDILLLDEILAIGDADFHKKCIKRMQDFRRSGCTLVLATHDLDAAAAFASHALWIENGRIRLRGEASGVIEEYRRSFQVPGIG